MKRTIDEVFIFSLWYYPSHFALHIEDVANAFSSQGIKVTIITIKEADYDHSYFLPFKHMFLKQEKEKHETIRLKMSALLDRGIYNPIVFIENYSEVLKLISERSKKHRVALYHFFDTFVPYYNKITLPNVKISCMYYAGNFVTRILNQLGNPVENNVTNKVIIDANMAHLYDKDGNIAGIDFILSQTKSFIKLLSINNPLLPAYYINRPFDITGALNANNIDIRRTYHLPKDSSILVYAGRPTKNASILLEIFSLVRKKIKSPIFLLLIGTQNYDISGWKHFKSEKKFILSIDYLERSVLYQFIKGCDIFVYTSLIDGQPKIINESQALEVPVVAFSSKSSSISELIIKNETGILVPEGNTKLFAKEIIKLIADPQRRTLLARNAKVFVKSHYSNKLFVNSFLSRMDKL